MKLLTSFVIVLGLFSFITAGYAASHSSKSEHHRHSHHSLSVDKAVHEKINLNKATADQLTQLKGVGTKKAQAIVAYRKQHGRFKSLDDLTNVKGISQRIVDLVKGHLVL